VTTLDDIFKRNVAAGVIDSGKLAVKGLQISGAEQQKELYALYVDGECRPYKIVLSDVLETTYEFCGTITGWMPNTASGKKNRLDFELTLSGDVVVSDTEGPYIPVVP
jgi:hypothetical protein